MTVPLDPSYFSSDQVPGMCTVDEEQSHLLIPTASAEFIRKVSKTNTSRMCSYNTMVCNNHDNTIIKQSRRANPIQPLSDISRRSAFIRSCPPTVDKIHGCNVNYKLAGPKGIPNVMNSSESSQVVPLLAQSSALQLPGISLCSIDI